VLSRSCPGKAGADGCSVHVLVGVLEPIWRRFVARRPGRDRYSHRHPPEDHV